MKKSIIHVGLDVHKETIVIVRASGAGMHGACGTFGNQPPAIKSWQFTFWRRRSSKASLRAFERFPKLAQCKELHGAIRF
jgi:hypothetical protein